MRATYYFIRNELRVRGIKMVVNTFSNLLLNDGVFKFYIEPLDNRSMASLVILDAYNGFVFRHNFLAEFGTNPSQSVFHGKSGTYEYYKITIKCNNVGQELVLLKMSANILRPIYLDNRYADLSTTRLRIETKKGRLNVKRIHK